MLVCDQPLLSAEHLKGLIAKHLNSPEETIVASDYTQLAGIPAIFPVSQFPALLQLQGDRGARSLLRDPAVPCITVPFPAGELDIDTPADLLNLSPK
jgi:molybdenum cofactor cytidylyltransferase